jgi:hypothetical protein
MKFKAILLLFILSLSSFSGFSCSINTQLKESIKKYNGMQYCCKNMHMDKKSIQSPKHTTVLKNNESCCQKSAKTTYVDTILLPQSKVGNFQLPVADIHNFISLNTIFPYQVKSSFKTLIDCPPKKDIRIAIQSFQI